MFPHVIFLLKPNKEAAAVGDKTSRLQHSEASLLSILCQATVQQSWKQNIWDLLFQRAAVPRLIFVNLYDQVRRGGHFPVYSTSGVVTKSLYSDIDLQAH